MVGNWKVGLGVLAGMLVMGVLVTLFSGHSVVGAEKDGGGVAKYTVVATDGTHLVVTDNQAAKVYFYAIDKDGKPGDELKLRGTMDLTQVGKEAIQPTKPK